MAIDYKKMINTIDFHKLSVKAQANLIKLSSMLTSVVPLETNAWRFSTNILQPGIKIPPIIFKVAHWAGRENIFLYMVCLVTEQCDLSEKRDAFMVAKKQA